MYNVVISYKLELKWMIGLGEYYLKWEDTRKEVYASTQEGEALLMGHAWNFLDLVQNHDPPFEFMNVKVVDRLT